MPPTIHYYSKKQTSDLNLTKVTIRVKNIFFDMFSGSGVFSKRKLDKGTEVLLKNLDLKKNIKVLDLGCGIGIVGIYAKKMFPSIKIFFSDINERAVYLTKKNLKLHRLEANVKQSDSFEKIDELFDCVLLNPPQVAGKEVCFKLIEDSYKHINSNGHLKLVARHNKGGQSYSKKMNSVFGNVVDIAKGSGYRVYLSCKN